MDDPKVKLIVGPVRDTRILESLPELFARAIRAQGPPHYAPAEIAAIITCGAGPSSALDHFRAGDGALLMREGEVIACGALVVGGRDFGSDRAVPADRGVVRAVCVAPEHGGQGHGRRIMAALEARAAERGVRRIGLTATLCAREFYLRLGYGDPRPVAYAFAGLSLKAVALSRAA